MISFYKQKTADLKRSFSSATNTIRAVAKVEALPKEFFSSLIETESDFRSNNYTVETLDILVQLYAKAVEHYDNIQDEISSYFTYKIQDILATKRSLKMLIDRKEQEKAEQPSLHSSVEITDSTSKISRPNESSIQEPPHQDLSCENLAGESSDEDGEKTRREEWGKKKETKKPAKSLASLKSQKQRFAQFYHQVEVESYNNKQDMQVLVTKYIKLAQENDQTVQSSITLQKRIFRQKLQKRKNNSFYTLNSTFTSIGSPNLSPQIFKKVDLSDDYILKELEDGKSSGELHTPVVKKRLKSQSLFAKKRESESRETIAEAREPKGQLQEKETLTSTENFLAENSPTAELKTVGGKNEVSNKEALKTSILDRFELTNITQHE